MKNIDPMEILDFTTDLARQAGQMVLDHRSSSGITIEYKENIEMVTSADLEADRFICSQIADRFPTHQIMSEELAPHLEDRGLLYEPLWIIDPIDGTVNYAYHHHQVAVSIAYAEAGSVQAGVVHCPFLGETFTAAKGNGARLNGSSIAASSPTDLRGALIATGFPYDKSAIPPLVAKLHRILEYCRDVRRTGSAALDICWVAMGRLDGYYEGLKPWDQAAASLIATEAGAKRGRWQPSTSDLPDDIDGSNLVVASEAILDDLIGLLATA
jgi:myo-inositol-1(or 4)-monophosphatase